MGQNPDILREVREAAAKRILFLSHAVRQMSKPERMIRVAEVRAILEAGDVVEDYPKDARGHSCLMLGEGQDGRPIHVVCAPKDEYLAVITAYVPDAAEWSADFRKRAGS